MHFPINYEETQSAQVSPNCGGEKIKPTHFRINLQVLTLCVQISQLSKLHVYFCTYFFLLEYLDAIIPLPFSLGSIAFWKPLKKTKVQAWMNI